MNDVINQSTKVKIAVSVGKSHVQPSKFVYFKSWFLGLNSTVLFPPEVRVHWGNPREEDIPGKGKRTWDNGRH